MAAVLLLINVFASVRLALFVFGPVLVGFCHSAPKHSSSLALLYLCAVCTNKNKNHKARAYLVLVKSGRSLPSALSHSLGVWLCAYVPCL